MLSKQLLWLIPLPGRTAKNILTKTMYTVRTVGHPADDHTQSVEAFRLDFLVPECHNVGYGDHLDQLAFAVSISLLTPSGLYWGLLAIHQGLRRETSL